MDAARWTCSCVKASQRFTVPRHTDAKGSRPSCSGVDGELAQAVSASTAQIESDTVIVDW